MRQISRATWYPLALALWALLVSGGASAREPWQIYIMTWRGCEEACSAFISHFEANQMAVEFTIRNAEQELSAIPALVAEAKRLAPDLVVTWGNSVTSAVIGPLEGADPDQHLTEIPVVYMYVSNPEQSGLATDSGTGRPNVAGTSYVAPVTAHLQAIRAYRPFQRLGVLYDPTQEGSVQRVELLRQLAEKESFQLVADPIPLDAEGRPDPAQLPEAVARLAAQQVQFVYFGYSSFLITHVQEFTSLAVDNGLPVFTAGAKPIYEGKALLGLFNHLSQIGQLAAFQAEQILVHGKQPGELPIARFSRYSVIVNIAVAHRLQLYPPMLLLGYAELIDHGRDCSAAPGSFSPGGTIPAC